MDISNLKNKILNIGIILLGGIIAVNIYKAQIKEINSLKERNEMEVKKNQLLEEIEMLNEKIQLYKNFINNKEINSIINTLRNIAKDSSVKIIAVKPMGEQKYPRYTKYPFALTLEAKSYHDIGNFIENLENHSDIYVPNSANIKSSGDDRSMSFSLQIETVLFGDQK